MKEEADSSNNQPASNSEKNGTSHVNIASWNCFTSTMNVKNGVALTNFKQTLRTWLLLDNQSTDNIFCNSDYLVNI